MKNAIVSSADAVAIADTRDRRSLRMRTGALSLLAGAALLLGTFLGCSEELDEVAEVAGVEEVEEVDAPLKIGALLVNSETQTEAALDRLRALQLAVAHVNEAGGALGAPVEVVEGDTADIENETRRLIEEEGVHAIVGPASSAHALLVVDAAAPEGVLVVSPVASSPLLTANDDRDLFFRTLLSDAAQGPALAQLARERGFDNVGLIYRDDAWGQGLADAFQQAWTGAVTAVPSPADETLDSYMGLIKESAEGGAQALVLLAFSTEAPVILRESLESGTYDQFLFGDALRWSGLAAAVGRPGLANMYGTASGTSHESAPAVALDAAFRAKYGKDPAATYVKETYDAAIAIMLAAEKAWSASGTVIRDELREVGSAPGEPVLAGPDGVALALSIIRDGDEIDYEGAASSMDWDENGDLSQGHIVIWRFTADDGIEDVEVLPYER